MNLLRTLRLALMSLIVLSVMAAGLTTPANAAPTAASVRPEAASSAARMMMPFPHTQKESYDYAFSVTVRHYRGVLNQRPGAFRWGWPDMPDWIQEGSWWIKKAAKCGIGVGTFFALAGTTKIKNAVQKITRFAKTDKEVRMAYKSLRALGGFSKALRVMGRFAKSRGKDVSKSERRHVKTIAVSGGTLVAEVLGVTACVQMILKVI